MEHSAQQLEKSLRRTPPSARREPVLVREIRAEWEGLQAELPDDYLQRCVTIGQKLLELKARLRGTFCESFARSCRQAADPGKVPFGERAAQRYMAIAKNPTMANPTEESDCFPKNYNTLAILAKIRPTRLQKAIDKGLIYPAMDAEDARNVVEICRPAPDEPLEKRTARLRQRKLKNVIRAVEELDSAHRLEFDRWYRARFGGAA